MENSVDLLAKNFQELIDAAREEGRAAGWKQACRAMSDEANRRALGPLPDADTPNIHRSLRAQAIALPTTEHDGKIVPEPFYPARERAPKGLIDDALLHTVRERPGMHIKDVEEAVARYDKRIAIKSVYNRLRAYQKNSGEYQRLQNRWYHRLDAPDERKNATPVDPNPVKEWSTGVLEPADIWTSARARGNGRGRWRMT